MAPAVCGFTFVKNAVKFSYPVVESIRSILPLCDRFIVLHGDSDDGTEELLKTIDSGKVRIIPSVWDASLRKGGRLLAVETNKAFDAVPPEYDWAFYLQADEVVHEKYLPAIAAGMEQWLPDKRVEGLLFDYVHFYGTYDYVSDSREWYRREIRIIRNDKSIRSYKDAQGFRKNGEKLRVKRIDASVYHYGWVKDPKAMIRKYCSINKLWHPDGTAKTYAPEDAIFDYSNFKSLRKFTESHPHVMAETIARQNFTLAFDTSVKRYSLRDYLLYYFEKITGYRPFEYKNYKVI